MNHEINLRSGPKLLSINEKSVSLFQQWIQMLIPKEVFVQKFFCNFDLPFSLIFCDFYDI